MFKYTKNGLINTTTKNYKNFMPLGMGYNAQAVEWYAKYTSFMSNNFKLEAMAGPFKCLRWF